MDTLRETWIENSLLPLYGGFNPLYSSHIVSGINFVAIDNSTYQITEEQLSFFKDQIELNMPVVLLLHIPFYLNKNAEDKQILTCGDPRWGWESDRNFRIEKRERWSKDGNLTSTLQFLESAKSSTKIVSILAGHTHEASIDKFSKTAGQYVTGEALNGQYRLIVFEPQ